MTQKQTETQEVKIPSLQLLMRKAILEVAVSEAVNKFTGLGYGDNLILRDSAEEIIATAMAVIKAQFNKTYITVGDTQYHACDYVTYGTGLAALMNWNGFVYISEIDDEKPEQALIKAERFDYVQDSWKDADGNTRKAGGKVVSPTKWEKHWASFNGLQAKVGENNKIAVGQSVDKAAYTMDEVQYAYQNGEMRELKTGEVSDVKLTQDIATIMKATIQFNAPTIGEASSNRAEQKLIEWLL